MVYFLGIYLCISFLVWGPQALASAQEHSLNPQSQRAPSAQKLTNGEVQRRSHRENRPPIKRIGISLTDVQKEVISTIAEMDPALVSIIPDKGVNFEFKNAHAFAMTPAHLKQLSKPGFVSETGADALTRSFESAQILSLVEVVIKDPSVRHFDGEGANTISASSIAKYIQQKTGSPENQANGLVDFVTRCLPVDLKNKDGAYCKSNTLKEFISPKDLDAYIAHQADLILTNYMDSLSGEKRQILEEALKKYS